MIFFPSENPLGISEAKWKLTTFNFPTSYINLTPHFADWKHDYIIVFLEKQPNYKINAGLSLRSPEKLITHTISLLVCIINFMQSECLQHIFDERRKVTASRDFNENSVSKAMLIVRFFINRNLPQFNFLIQSIFLRASFKYIITMQWLFNGH